MRRLALVAIFLLLQPLAAAAKGYSAQRFDVTIHPLADGAIQVTETLALTFEGGSFTYVSREIPLRRTDGIEVLGASMDGRVLSRGGDPGQFDVRVRESRVAVRWHFAATASGGHDFRLSYVARGVVQQSDIGPLLEWQAHPTEHPYAIASSRIVIDGLPADREPALRTRRVAHARADFSGDAWVIEASDIGSNGWLMISSPTTVAAGIVPRWQQREREQRALAPRMLQFGLIALVASLALVLLVWRQYPPPPFVDREPSSDAPPANHAPAIAGAILAGGHATNAHAAGTLFDLASRKVVSIAEAERGWKPGRRFTLARGTASALAAHETALLDVMFKEGDTVDFSTAFSRFNRKARAFRHAVNEELLRLGLADEHRGAPRRRLLGLGLILALLVAAGAVAVAVTDVGPWGLAIPFGIAVPAGLAVVLGATRAELSDEGFRERERWRSFKRTMAASLSTREASDFAQTSALRYLPYVAALGLGMTLSRFLKRHGGQLALPPWFQALGGGDGTAALAAFIGSTSHASGASGAAGSGAAGGGSSGAG